jgi:hypothetical protein
VIHDQTSDQTLRCGDRASHRVFRQAIQQLLNGIVVVLFKLETRPNNTFLKRERLVGDEIRHNRFDLLSLVPSVPERRLKEVRLREI